MGHTPPVTTFIAAAAQYSISQLRDWDDYAAKVTLSLDLAMRLGLHILAASAPCGTRDDRYVNRARLSAPHGAMGWQDKLIMTRFEREQWGVSCGAKLRLFDTDLGRIGIIICYDSEFPLIARAMVEAGAGLLLVPSCTDTAHGYWRVRLSAQARALEGQCYTIQSPTVGEAPWSWSPAVDVNHGAAGIYTPPDGALPPDGVVAIGGMDAHRNGCLARLIWRSPRGCAPMAPC